MALEVCAALQEQGDFRQACGCRSAAQGGESSHCDSVPDTAHAVIVMAPQSNPFGCEDRPTDLAAMKRQDERCCIRRCT